MSRVRPLAAAGLCALVACAGTARIPLPPDDPRPAAFVAAWTRQSAGREALRGSARLAVDAEARGGAAPVRLRARQTLALERPARLRIEVQGMLGTTLAVLAVDGEEYALYEAETRRFERGPLQPDLLWRVAGLALLPEEVVEVVLGSPRLAPGLALRAAFAAPDGGVRVDLEGDAGEQRALRFDAEGRLRELVTRDPERAAWTATFDDYAPVAGEALAHRVSIDTGSARAVLQLRDVELNPQLPADIFRLDGLAARSGAEGG